MQTTPAFARWALAHSCEFREEASDPYEPAAVERQLRPLQKASHAIGDGRVVDGIAVSEASWRRLRDEPRAEVDLSAPDGDIENSAMGAGSVISGFDVEEIIDYYGGGEAADSLCGGCPANAGESQRSRWAGCFGMAMPPWGGDPAELDELAEATGAASVLDDAFPAASPRWYGWWIEPEWSRSQIDAFATALVLTDEMGRSLGSTLVGGDALATALERARAFGLGVRTVAFPPGRIEGRNWRVAAHCPRCKAPNDASMKFCRVCRRSGGMFPERTRKARGERPFRSLTSLVSAERYRRIVRAVVENDASD